MLRREIYIRRVRYRLQCLNLTSPGNEETEPERGRPLCRRHGAAPTDVVNHTREFLISVFENKEEAIGDRMDALQLSRKFEAKRVMPQTVHLTRREESDRK